MFAGIEQVYNGEIQLKLIGKPFLLKFPKDTIFEEAPD